MSDIILGSKGKMGQAFIEGFRVAVTKISTNESPEGLSAGDIVAISGTSKGKGFAGVVRRWHLPVVLKLTASLTGKEHQAQSGLPRLRVGF